MNENETPLRDAGTPRRCALPWCTTAHGATQHPDDEAHRSDGLGLPVRLRTSEGAGAVDVEVGIVRRLDDDEAWIALEGADGRFLEIPVCDARAVLRQVLRDEALAHALGAGS
jgi:hypothetical protein